MSRGGLLRAEIVPFLGALGMLAAATLLVDAALHLMNVVWVGRYLGIVGTSLILFGLATIFMRNQVKPIRRLAQAADSFGKGRDVSVRPFGSVAVLRIAIFDYA